MSPPQKMLVSESSPLFSIRWSRKTKAVATDIDAQTSLYNDPSPKGTSTTVTSREDHSSTLSSITPANSASPPVNSFLPKTLPNSFSFISGSRFVESKFDLQIPVSNKTQVTSPATVLGQRIVRQASNLKFRVRRKKLDKELPQPRESSKVPRSDQEESFAPDPPSTPDTVLPISTQISTRRSTLSPSNFKPLSLSIRSKQVQRQSQKGYLHKSQSINHTFVKMASESAQPPVPYLRLQQITTSACEKALGSITGYNHASTEDWNTTIINTILGTLVEETTPKSSDGQAQPPFKFVVNSTIIQHAPVSSGSPVDPAVTGRRGMHAASGAFWSNEKDGMWSYKYSAAENKGFDVVVGIIWVWVG